MILSVIVEEEPSAVVASVVWVYYKSSNQKYDVCENLHRIATDIKVISQPGISSINAIMLLQFLAIYSNWYQSISIVYQLYVLLVDFQSMLNATWIVDRIRFS